MARQTFVDQGPTEYQRPPLPKGQPTSLSTTYSLGDSEAPLEEIQGGLAYGRHSECVSSFNLFRLTHQPNLSVAMIEVLVRSSFFNSLPPPYPLTSVSLIQSRTFISDIPQNPTHNGNCRQAHSITSTSTPCVSLPSPPLLVQNSQSDIPDSDYSPRLARVSAALSSIYVVSAVIQAFSVLGVSPVSPTFFISLPDHPA